MNSPKISIRESPFKSTFKENSFVINNQNLNQFYDDKIDDIIYMASEISQLIAKLLLDSTVYVEISRLFKISQNKSIEFLQIIIAENLSNEYYFQENKSNPLFHYFKNENYSSISFLSPSSSKLCGLDEFLAIPLKNLTVPGAELIGKSVKQLTPHILLSTPSEMFWDKVPFPDRNYLNDAHNFIFSQNCYSSPDNDPANLLAIDCEMVNTGDGNNLELARVCVVRCCRNVDLKTVKGIKQWLSFSKSLAYEVVYDKLVKPKGEIVDYLTKYSGITESTLANVATTLSDVQAILKDLIQPNTILVGHSIQSDLKALKIYHPYIIDTSSIYNMSGDFTRKPGLKPLSIEILKQEIRKSGKKLGHDPVEDAQTALRLVIMKLSKDLNFGNKTRALYNHPNSILGEWKEVPVSENSNKFKASGSQSRIQQKTVIKCILESGELSNQLTTTIECTDLQMKIDKFTLMKEQPAVVKTTELLYKMKLAIQVIVNTHGIIGQQQFKNSCQSIIKVLSDEEVVKQTLLNFHTNDVLISVLSDCKDINESRESEFGRKILSIRESIKKIVKGIPKKSAIFVILPGTNGSESAGKFFWKIS